MQKYCILFAGAVGSSKSPIAFYLSAKLKLPIFNSDIIRTEVLEDLGEFSQEQFAKRTKERLNSLMSTETSVILDLSIDREWKNLRSELKKNCYQYFIVSINLSKPFLSKLYQIKDYQESLSRIDELFNQHLLFLAEYESDISVNINDDDFANRLDITFTKLDLLINNPK